MDAFFDLPFYVRLPILLAIGMLLGFALRPLTYRLFRKSWVQRGRDARSRVEKEPRFYRRFETRNRQLQRYYDEGFYQGGPLSEHVQETWRGLGIHFSVENPTSNPNR